MAIKRDNLSDYTMWINHWNGVSSRTITMDGMFLYRLNRIRFFGILLTCKAVRDKTDVRMLVDKLFNVHSLAKIYYPIAQPFPYTCSRTHQLEGYTCHRLDVRPRAQEQRRHTAPQKVTPIDVHRVQGAAARLAVTSIRHQSFYAHRAAPYLLVMNHWIIIFVSTALPKRTSALAHSFSHSRLMVVEFIKNQLGADWGGGGWSCPECYLLCCRLYKGVGWPNAGEKGKRAKQKALIGCAPIILPRTSDAMCTGEGPSCKGVWM